MSGTIVMAEVVTLLERKNKTLLSLLKATRGNLCILYLGSYNLFEIYLVLNFSNGVSYFFILLFRRRCLLKLLHKTNKNSTGGVGAKLLCKQYIV